MKRARLRLEPLGGTSSVVIVDEDGTEHDITGAVSEVETLRYADGHCTAIITLPDAYIAAASDRTAVDHTTRDALLALGWTPPSG